MSCLSALLELPSRHICRSCCRLPSTAERTWSMLLALRLLPPSLDRTIIKQPSAPQPRRRRLSSRADYLLNNILHYGSLGS
jgi:hypothetical protein